MSSEESALKLAAPVKMLGSELEFLRSVLASSGDCIKVLDMDGNLVYMNEAGQELMQVSDFNAVRGCPWPDLWRDALHDEANHALELARSGGEGRFVGEAETFLGNSRWWDVRVTPIRDSHGHPEGMLVVSRDITIQKKAETQKHFLMLEMAHRVKNILAVVQAIATMSLRDGVDIALARDNFNARLFALARAQDQLLQKSEQQSATISGLLSQVLSIHGNPSQLIWQGPEIVFGSTFGLSFSLVMHELYTNALKYGALSREQGLVSISWTVSGNGPERRFAFEWVECGGPVVHPPTRRGFGSRLIEHSLTKSQKSSVKMTYAPGGVQFQLKADLSYALEN